MRHGRARLVSTLLLAFVMAMFGTLAYAQGGSTTTTLSGTVIDSSGGVIPGADIVAKHNATAAETRAVSDAEGHFSIPALQPGTYTVTVSLMGFKTWSSPDVNLVAATPVTLKATLEVGKLEETVVVQGAAEIVQTQSASVSTTLTTAQITNVPLATRNTLDFVTALPGVNTTGTFRGSSVMGLQPSAVNITIDGINVQDNFFKSDSNNSFFARINPRMDAVEEVTVSTANPGAESAGQGAVQIRFQTRSGTNKFTGSAYEYHREPGFNSNYWFNIRDGIGKDQIKLNTYGFRQGGPIMKDKLFFFFNYEEFRQPGTQSRTRTFLVPDAIAGKFNYNGAAAPVDLLALAAANGQIATPDPAIQSFLTAVANSANGSNLLSTGNPITRNFSFSNPYSQLRRYPTARVDYNVSSKNRLGVSYYLQQYRSIPDTLNTFDARFPGFPGTGGQNSDRFSYMANWRWTINSNMVSEVRGGVTGGPVLFGDGITRDTWKQGPFAPFNGFLPAISTTYVSTTYTSNSPNERDAPTYVLEDTISWIKGKHGINIGGSFTQVNLNYTIHRLDPTLSFGLDPNDPANLSAMFAPANFPGASDTDISNAKYIYSLLTGRVTSINGTAYLNGATGKYEYLGDAAQVAHMREFGFYVQDAWRVKPNLTLNYGLRYELQMPFVSLNNFYSRPLSYANAFGYSGLNADGTPNINNPSFTNQDPTQFKAFNAGDKAFDTQWKNFAPSFGVAWRPTVNGTLKKILGEDPVLRGGYSKAYTREGIQAISGLYYYNPGGSTNATRNMALGNLVPAGGSLPILLRNGTSNLGPGSFPDSPAYPILPPTNADVNEFYPGTTTPYAHSFNVSFQRQLNKNTVVDFRYVGTRNLGGWQIGGRSMNEVNVLENGFLNEFKLAQANLAANIAAGRGNTFAYTGAAGTSPLPIFQAYLAGQPAANASNTALYTSSFYRTSGYYGYLAKYNPDPQNLAYYLQTASSTYAVNAKNAGLPANFFMVNPGVQTGNVWITGRPEDARNNRYDAIQMELKRRMTNGFVIQGSYQYQIRAQATSLYTIRMAGQYVDQGTPHHVFKANWVWELPFGQGHRFGGNASRGMNRLIGGWSFVGNLRAQSGNTIDFGNRRLVGMTDADLQRAFKLRYQVESDGRTHVYMLPQDIIDNTRRAYSTSATSATGYSTTLGVPTGRYFAPVSTPDCINAYSGYCTGGAPLHHYVTGPKFFRTDASIAKRIDVTSRVYFDLRAEVMNVFNNIDFFGTNGIGTTTGAYEVTSAYRDASNTQDPGGRLMQLSFRISW